MANVAGQRFGRLIAVERTDVTKGPHKLWRCVYDCGKEILAFVGNLKGGRQQSCGCLAQESRIKHGFSTRTVRHPIYSVWLSMNDRCRNPRKKEWKNYGGRGIKVCDEWQADYTAFHYWAEANGWRKGLDIDRIDNDGPYAPWNCRFISRSRNMGNTRRHRDRELPVGVHRSGKKFRTALTVQGQTFRLHGFDTPEEAGAAYRAMQAEHGL